MGLSGGVRCHCSEMGEYFGDVKICGSKEGVCASVYVRGTAEGGGDSQGEHQF